MGFTLADDIADEEEVEATNDYSSYWQSIPDPPTPPVNSTANSSETAAAASTTGDLSAPTTSSAAVSVAEVAATSSAYSRNSSRNRKRDSFAFRDVTNRQAPGDGEKKRPPESIAAASLNSSLGPVEEEVPNADEEDNNAHAVIQQKKRKKRRKRKSLLLPSDDIERSAIQLSSGKQSLLVAKADGKKIKSTFEIMPDSRDGLGGNSDDVIVNTNQQLLLQSIRAYCSLPKDQRDNSHESAQIESLTGGYPMPGKLRPIMNNFCKEEFLLRVQPIVQEMENQKQKDILETRLATQCEVKKNGRGGGFCYFNVTTGEQIHPQEYKRRYALMVEERRQKCNRRKEDVDVCVDDVNLRVKKTGEEQDSSGKCIEEKKVHNDSKIPNDDAKNCEPTVVINSHIETVGGRIKSVEEKSPCEDSTMDMDESVNMDESMMSLDDSVAEEMAPSLDGKADASPTTLDDANEVDSEGVSIESREQENNNDDSQQHPILAGMPPSNDPRVLRARQKLWRAIDTALATYSQEILDIERAGSNVEAAS